MQGFPTGKETVTPGPTAGAPQLQNQLKQSGFAAFPTLLAPLNQLEGEPARGAACRQCPQAVIQKGQDVKIIEYPTCLSLDEVGVANYCEESPFRSALAMS